MTISPFQALACPLDGFPLHREGGSWRCSNGHCFDVASQGYINLLPVQNKRSRDPGDSKEMVAARRRFLESGFYQPIAASLVRLVQDACPPRGEFSCLDAGCGEGYYLRQLVEAISTDQNWSMLGLDISKWAVMSAAKQDRRMSWVVGSNANLPILSGKLDCILCMFGFPVYNEFARVLHPGGRLIQVDAGPDHLRELREVIYPSLKAERDKSILLPDGFALASSETLQFSFDVKGAGLIGDLLAMTPHLYRATPEGRSRAAALTSLSLSADIRLSSWVRI